MTAILAGAAVVLLVLGVAFGVILLSRQMQNESLQQRFRASSASINDTADQRAIWGQLARHGRQIDSWFDEKGETERLLLRAGLKSPSERMPYFVVQLVMPLAAVAFAGAKYVLGAFAEEVSTVSLLTDVSIVVVGLLAPRWWLRSRAKTRQMQLRSEVPMLIHLLALLFDAGLSLRQALATLTHDGASVLPQTARELGMIVRQLETGADVSEVIHSTSQVLEISELSSVLSVLQQVDRYGGELRAPLMDVLELVEKRRELGLREKVSAMAGKMTVVMVLFFFPALLIFVAGPAFMAILAALGGAN